MQELKEGLTNVVSPSLLFHRNNPKIRPEINLNYTEIPESFRFFDKFAVLIVDGGYENKGAPVRRKMDSTPRISLVFIMAQIYEIYRNIPISVRMDVDPV